MCDDVSTKWPFFVVWARSSLARRRSGAMCIPRHSAANFYLQPRLRCLRWMRLGNMSDHSRKSLTKTIGAYQFVISTLAGAQRDRFATAFFILLSSNYRESEGQVWVTQTLSLLPWQFCRLILGKIIARLTGRRQIRHCLRKWHPLLG
jgi:hypothetical protein